MAAYYSVKKNKDRSVDIESNNPNAKQALWSWAGDYGSTHDEGAIELYGNDTPYGGPGDRKRWHWHLTPAGIASITRSFKLQLADPKKYDATAAENACARELLKKLGISAARAGGKSRHTGAKLERSYLRPFATYCSSCHAHLGGKEHAWRVKGTEQYLCNACGGGTGGGKKRHALSKDERLLAGMRRLGVAWKKGRALPTYKARMTPAQKLKADKLYDKMSEKFIDQMASDVRKLLK